MSKNLILASVFSGVTMGLLSAIPFVNWCCWLWAFLSGFVAAYFYSRRASDMDSAKGLLLGVLSGVVGGAVFGGALPFTTTGFFLLLGEKEAGTGEIIGMTVVIGILFFFVFLVESVVGGLIGAQFFRKPNAANYPPYYAPPPSQ
jgi:hypothetical protein